MATPQFGSLVFVGASRRTYNKDILLDDVNNANINVDSGGGASSTSDTFWTPPENVALVDYAQVAGTADTEKIQMVRNGIPTGDMLRYTIHLTSLNNRPRLNIPFARGDKVSAIQISD